MANTQNEETLYQLENSLGEAEQFVEKNKNRLLIGIGIVVAIILGIFSYNKFIKKPNEQKAASQMHQAEINLERDSVKLALNGDANYPGFLKIIDQYSGTPAANNAKYYAGVCYMKLGEYDQAIKMLESFSSSDPMLEPISIGLTADAYMEKDNIAKAKTLYKKAIEKAKGNNLVAPIYMKKLGTVCEKEQKFAEALEVYQALKAEYPTSTEGREADKYIQAMKIKLNK